MQKKFPENFQILSKELSDKFFAEKNNKYQDIFLKIFEDFDYQNLIKLTTVNKLFKKYIGQKFLQKNYLIKALSEKLKNYGDFKGDLESLSPDLLLKVLMLQHIVLNSKPYVKTIELITEILNHTDFKKDENLRSKLLVNLLASQIIIDPQLSYYKDSELLGFGLNLITKVAQNYPNDINVCFISAAYWSLIFKNAFNDIREITQAFNFNSEKSKQEKIGNLLTSGFVNNYEEIDKRMAIAKEAKINYENFLNRGIALLHHDAQQLILSNPAITRGLAHPHVYTFLIELIKYAEKYQHQFDQENANIISEAAEIDNPIPPPSPTLTAEKIYLLSCNPYRTILGKVSANELIESNLKDLGKQLNTKIMFFSVGQKRKIDELNSPDYNSNSNSNCKDSEASKKSRRGGIGYF